MPRVNENKAKRHELSITNGYYQEGLTVDEVEEKMTIEKSKAYGRIIFSQPVITHSNETVYFQFKLHAPEFKDVKSLAKRQRLIKNLANPKIYIGLTTKRIATGTADIFRAKDSGLLCLNLNSGDKFFQGRWREYWVLGDNQEERSQLTSFWREDTEGNEVKMRKNKNDSINSMIRMQNGINMSSMLQSSRLNQEMSALADTLNDDNFKDGTVIGIAVDTSSV